MNVSNFVIGMGNVGQALYNVLKETYPDIQGYDRNTQTDINVTCDTLHICIPWNYSFDGVVYPYIQKLQPKLTIIHSTVKVGTTEGLRINNHFHVVHSPIIGQHDNLEKSLLIFEKWVGGDRKDCLKAKKVLSKAGMKVKVKSTSQVTELAKLLSTYRYGISIARAQEEAAVCQQIDLNFAEVVTEFIDMYNKGYKKLGMDWVQQPNTFPGEIGGHCVLPNLELLKNQYPNMIFPKAIEELNNRTKNE